MNLNRPIAIFDSGLGGLTVLRAFRAQFLNEDVIYYADTKNVPYGEKSPDDIRSMALSIVDYLHRRNVKAIAFGCNISSAVALEDAQKKYVDVPMMGLISSHMAEEARKDSGGRVSASASGVGRAPGAGVSDAGRVSASASGVGRAPGAGVSDAGRIGVIATTATVLSGQYPLVLKAGAENVDVFMCACKPFVPLIESGRTSGVEVDEAIESVLEPLVSARVDTVVYGCSHYPFIEEPIKAYFQKRGMSPRMVDPAVPLARAAKVHLKKIKLNNIRLGTGIVKFVVSGPKAPFKENLKKLGIPFHDSMIFSPPELDEELAPIR